MIPPIVEIAEQNPALVALIGSNPFRFYAFGDAGDNKVYPYVTYQNIGGDPENFLGDRPDADSFVLQINCLAKTEAEANQVADAVSYALELDGHVIGWGGTDRDPVTRNYRCVFTLEFINRR